MEFDPIVFFPLTVGYEFNKRTKALSYLHYSSNTKCCTLKSLCGLGTKIK